MYGNIKKKIYVYKMLMTKHISLYNYRETSEIVLLNKRIYGDFFFFFRKSFTMLTNRSVADKRSHARKGRGITEVVTRTWLFSFCQTI